MRATATVVLLAPLDDAWRFATDPFLHADWWPGIAALVPDRRGLAPGARWEVRRTPRPSLLRKAAAHELLLVQAVEPKSLFRWHLTGERLDCELTLAAEAENRTRVTLTVTSAVLAGGRRSAAKVALGRLHALCQTGAEA
jgi:uncharacterized protein YndB with AHSA1/START domain